MDPNPSGSPEILSTGSLKLDLTLPFGGIPAGNVLLIHGPRESGKTVLCLAMLARNAVGGRPGVFIDADGTLEAGFAVRCGLDPDLVYISKPALPTDALDIAETMLSSGAWPLLVVDSASALVDTGDEAQDAAGEKALSAYLPRLRRLTRQKGSLLVFSERPHPQSTPVYHDLKKHLPRLALPLHADWRFSLAPLPEGLHDQTTRKAVQVHVTKGEGLNTGNPILTIQINLMYNQGIARSGEILELGLYHSIIQRRGAEYQFRGLRIGDGLEEASGFLSAHPDLAALIEQDIRRFYRAAT
jgi:recombination protein RecA